MMALLGNDEKYKVGALREVTWRPSLTLTSCMPFFFLCFQVGHVVLLFLSTCWGQPTMTLNPLMLSQNESSPLTLFQSGIFVTPTRQVTNKIVYVLSKKDSLLQPIKLIFLSLKIWEKFLFLDVHQNKH